MPSTESRYVPVVHIIAGTVAGVLFARLVTTNLGGWSYLVFILATLGASSLLRDGWSAFHRMRLNRSCKEAYEKVARILKPEILDPLHPGNPDFMKADAQRPVRSCSPPRTARRCPKRRFGGYFRTSGSRPCRTVSVPRSGTGRPKRRTTRARSSRRRLRTSFRTRSRPHTRDRTCSSGGGC